MPLLTVGARAQWVHYPTPGIPRTADGKPNLASPAPHTPDGKPDLSGLWELKSDRFYNNIAIDLKRDDTQPWAEARYQQHKNEFGQNGMEANCLPLGPALSTSPYRESKIIQTPNLIAILADDFTFRQIYLDGRRLEAAPNPSWMGYSVGHWEGDTLVVESNGYNERVWLDYDGHPHTEQLRITEQFRRTDFGHIQHEVTLNDPGAYNKPWTVNLQMDLVADEEMLEYVCENEKSRAHMPGSAKQRDLVVPGETLAAYAGSYAVDDHGKKVIAEVTVEAGNLYWNYDGTGRQKLDPLSLTTFSLTGTAIEFIRDGPGSATHFIMTTVEGETTGRQQNR
jgi:hypothetical protein